MPGCSIRAVFLIAALSTATFVHAAPPAGTKPLSPVEARKELTAMGLGYANQEQFRQAIARRDLIAVDLFIAAKGFELQRYNGEVLTALQKNDLELGSKLIKAGVPVTPRMLALAISLKNLEMVRYLVEEHGANAAWLNRPALIVEENKATFTLPLHFAAHYGNAEVVNYLIDKGANVNAIDAKLAQGRRELIKAPETALMSAARALNADTVKVLLARGADPNRVVIQEHRAGRQIFTLAAGIAEARHTALSYVEDKEITPGPSDRREAVVGLLKGRGAKHPEEVGAASAAATETR